MLAHSKEVAVIAGMLAAEIGVNREIAKRGALLHDIGKGIETDARPEPRRDRHGARAQARRGSAHHQRDRRAPQRRRAHLPRERHRARSPTPSRRPGPGARRETLDNYIKRLENLENIAESFSGVDKAYAIQAGRELRILVNNEQVSDEGAKELCKSIAKKIETDLRYPGRIKVTIIRETRIVEYAR